MELIQLPQTHFSSELIFKFQMHRLESQCGKLCHKRIKLNRQGMIVFSMSLLTSKPIQELDQWKSRKKFKMKSKSLKSKSNDQKKLLGINVPLPVFVCCLTWNITLNSDFIDIKSLSVDHYCYQTLCIYAFKLDKVEVFWKGHKIWIMSKEVWDFFIQNLVPSQNVFNLHILN